jgi:hypothetical protein
VGEEEVASDLPTNDAMYVILTSPTHKRKRSDDKTSHASRLMTDYDKRTHGHGCAKEDNRQHMASIRHVGSNR